MNPKLIGAFFVASGVVLSLASAQPQTISDAPKVADAPVASTAPVAARSAPVTTGPDQAVYTAQLPAVEELTRAAAAKGTSVTRVEQTTSEITTTYQLQNGQTHVVAYRLLPTTVSVSSPSAPLIVTTPPPPVVHVPRSRVVYYDSHGWDDPWFWSPRLSLRVSLGHPHGHYNQYNRWYHGYRGHYGYGGFHHRGFAHRSHYSRHR